MYQTSKAGEFWATNGRISSPHNTFVYLLQPSGAGSPLGLDWEEWIEETDMWRGMKDTKLWGWDRVFLGDSGKIWTKGRRKYFGQEQRLVEGQDSWEPQYHCEGICGTLSRTHTEGKASIIVLVFPLPFRNTDPSQFCDRSFLPVPRKIHPSIYEERVISPTELRLGWEVVLDSFCDFETGKRHLGRGNHHWKNRLHQLSLWAVLWGIFLIKDRCGWAFHPTGHSGCHSWVSDPGWHKKAGWTSYEKETH